MKKIFLSLILVVCATAVSAQEKFTDKLTKKVPGQGTVTVIQDAEIKKMVDGSDSFRSVVNTVGHPSESDSQSVSTTRKSSTRKMKANGYRIQVYAGGNSRASRQEAQSMASRVRSEFPEWSVYTHFQSPRWICRVGDFQTYEEAASALRELRATNRFNEALIVKSVILIPY